MSGYSGTPLAQKLGIKAGRRRCPRFAPADYLEWLAPLRPVEVVTRLNAGADLIHLCATRRAKLPGMLANIPGRLRFDAALWVSWPKKVSGVATEITEDTIRELARPQGLVDIKVCAVDETWSGLKLVIRRSARPAATPVRRR
ncbi:MAG TPA: hypothetical protein VGI91_03210 [Steroidobacteraceae bacterium]